MKDNRFDRGGRDEGDALWDGIDWHGHRDFRIGSRHDDQLSGRGGDDLILALGGDDRAFGGKGDDLILSGPGDDIVDGGAGRDLLVAGAGDDLVRGGKGDDFIWAGTGDDIILGGAGRDVIAAGAGADTILVEAGDWRSARDTDLLLSPVDDSVRFALDEEVESVTFTAGAFARSADNEISGSIFTYAAIFEDGDTVAETDAALDFVGTADDPETLVLTDALVTMGVDAQAMAGVLGRVPDDDMDLLGHFMMTVTTADGGRHSYAADFTGPEGDFTFDFAALNGSSLAAFVWDETGFAMDSASRLTDDGTIMMG